MTDYTIRVCPECGEQETLHAEHNAPPTYCLNHEDEPGRTERPAHVVVAVARLSTDAPVV